MNLVDLNPVPATAEMIVTYYNVTLDALRKRHLTRRLKRFESIKDRQRQFAEAKDELSIEAGFMMLAYVESLFRMDFVARLENRKWKDPLSAHFRKNHKASSPFYRYPLDDIFIGWRREGGTCDDEMENILRRLPQYFDYRNWVAHGRYWSYKEKDFLRRYNFDSLCILVDEIKKHFEGKFKKPSRIGFSPC